MQFRTDLAIEAREIAGENTGGIEFKKYSENGLEISRLLQQISTTQVRVLEWLALSATIRNSVFCQKLF